MIIIKVYSLKLANEISAGVIKVLKGVKPLENIIDCLICSFFCRLEIILFYIYTEFYSLNVTNIKSRSIKFGNLYYKNSK